MKKIYLLLLFFCLNTIFSQTLNFQNLVDMSVGRGAITGVIVNDDIYISNGYKETGNPDANYIEKYNITNNTWSIFNSSLISKRFANSETYNNKIYIFNGWWNNKMEILDIASNTITFGADNPFYAGASGSAIKNGKIYVFGGSLLNGVSNTYSNKFQFYDIASNTWNTLPDMPTAKETKGEIVNNKLYVIGGYNGNNSNIIDVFDLNLNQWTEQYTMPVGVSGHSTAVLNDKIFIVGDYDNLTFLAYFDTTKNQLFQLSSNMNARRHSASEFYNNKLYVIGGNTNPLISSSIKSTQVAEISLSELSTTESQYYSLKVYPNPFTSELIISNKVNDKFDFIVFSFDGRQVAKGSGYYNRKINLSNLTNGVYIFSFKNEKGLIEQFKIIKK